MKDHFMISETDGALYDTRDSNWSKNPPLREKYSWHFRNIETVAQFKATLRAGQYAFPGGYELLFIANDGGAICFDCAKKEFHLIADSIRNGHNDGWRIVTCDMVDLYEDGLACDHCGRIMVEFSEEES